MWTVRNADKIQKIKQVGIWVWQWKHKTLPVSACLSPSHSECFHCTVLSSLVVQVIRYEGMQVSQWQFVHIVNFSTYNKNERYYQLKGSVQQPDNFHFYSFGKTQLKFSTVEKAIFVTNIRKNTRI